MTKLIQLQDLNTNEDLSPVVSIEGLRDKDGQKVDLSRLGGGNADVEISSTDEADLVLQDSTGAKFAEIANGAVRTPQFDMTPEQLAYLNRFKNASCLVVGSYESSLQGHMIWDRPQPWLNLDDTTTQYFKGLPCNTYIDAMPQDMWWYKMAKNLGMSVDNVKVIAYGNSRNLTNINNTVNPSSVFVNSRYYTNAMSYMTAYSQRVAYDFCIFVMNENMLSHAFVELASDATNINAMYFADANKWYKGFKQVIDTMTHACNVIPLVVMLHDNYTAPGNDKQHILMQVLQKLSMSFEIPVYTERDGSRKISSVQPCSPFKLMHVHSVQQPTGNTIDKAITAAVLSNY